MGTALWQRLLGVSQFGDILGMECWGPEEALQHGNFEPGCQFCGHLFSSGGMFQIEFGHGLREVLRRILRNLEGEYVCMYVYQRLGSNGVGGKLKSDGCGQGLLLPEASLILLIC